MGALSNYPALQKAFSRATIEFVGPLLLVIFSVITLPGVLSDPKQELYKKVLSTAIGGLFLYMLIAAINKLLNRGRLELELRDYAATWGNEHNVLGKINEIMTLHKYGQCVVADGWVIVPPDLEEKGFFPIDQISHLYIRETRSGYHLWAVLVDTREFKLGKNRRQAAIAYRTILKYNPRIALDPSDEGAFSRLLGIWSKLHGLRDEDDPETYTLRKSPLTSANKRGIGRV